MASALGVAEEILGAEHPMLVSYWAGNRIASHCCVSIKHFAGDEVFFTALRQIPFLLGKKVCTRADLRSLVQLHHNCVGRNCVLQNCPSSVTWFILSCWTYHSALARNSPGTHLWPISLLISLLQIFPCLLLSLLTVPSNISRAPGRDQ